MKEKNNLLQAASIMMIVCAVLAIIITAVNISSSLSSMMNLTPDESAAVEAQLNEGGITMDQAVMAVSGIAYAALGVSVIFNVIKIIVGILGSLSPRPAAEFSYFILSGLQPVGEIFFHTSYPFPIQDYNSTARSPGVWQNHIPDAYFFQGH